MFQTISNIFKVEDLRKKILFTLGILIVYRLGAFIPVPNIDTEFLKNYDQSQTNDIFGMLNTFTGGALFNFSVFAMGIMPYITASIIVQLLEMDVVPKFAQWMKEGEMGRRKLAQVTRYGTVILGLIQAYGLAIGFNRMYSYKMVIDPNVATYTLIALVLTAGTALLMWLGEQITESGIGNGISILIFAGIIARFPTDISLIYRTEFGPEATGNMFLSILKMVVIVIAVLAIVAGCIYVQQGVRKIPVQYAKRIVGRKMYGGQSTHIPLKVNAAGVIPVIFAISLIAFPTTLASFWQGKPIANWIIDNLYYDKPLGMVLYVLLIIGFTYFYTFVQINPVQMADQMKKNGGYIPGIRPGKTTQIYLIRIMNRITLTGSIFLAAVSILPIFFVKLAGLPSAIQIGGTSLLIVTGVALDTMKQVESQLIKRHYKGFINK
ncbi:MAG TPA: preprotein translocase subunit SecY [Bacilli bacterium]